MTAPFDRTVYTVDRERVREFCWFHGAKDDFAKTSFQ